MVTDSSTRTGPDPAHYPDIAATGDLRAALQAAFDTTGVPLHAWHVSSPGWLRVAAEIRAGDRHANVGMALNERMFLLDCWMHGVHMATGRTDNLSDIAAAIPTFLSGIGVRQFAATWPFMRTWGFAEAFERGEPDAIAYRWRQYLERPPARARHMVNLHELVVAAASQPRLRAMFLFTSHQDLGFRRSIHDRNSEALAWARPFGAGRYLIAGPDRRQLYSPGPVHRTLWGDEPAPGALGPADAQDSVAMLLDVLNRQPKQ